MYLILSQSKNSLTRLLINHNYYVNLVCLHCSITVSNAQWNIKSHNLSLKIFFKFLFPCMTKYFNIYLILKYSSAFSIILKFKLLVVKHFWGIKVICSCVRLESFSLFWLSKLNVLLVSNKRKISWLHELWKKEKQLKKEARTSLILLRKKNLTNSFKNIVKL